MHNFAFCFCRDAEERNLVVSPAKAEELFPELDCWQKEGTTDASIKTFENKPMKNEVKVMSVATVPMHASRPPRPMLPSKPMVSMKSDSLRSRGVEPLSHQDYPKKMRRDSKLMPGQSSMKTKKRENEPLRAQSETSRKYPKIPDMR